MGAERPRLRGLYAITPEMPDTGHLVHLVGEALEGGAALVQYRAKDIDAALAREQAVQLVALCARFDVPLIVNDSLSLARDVGAGGVHLGRDDGDVPAARASFAGLLGVSCYDDSSRASTAARDGADYVAIGSVFASGTKPGAVRAPLERLGGAREVSGLPVVAIGGITVENAPRAIAAGADMVAVVGALFGAKDVRAAAREFARLFDPLSQPSRDDRNLPQPV